MNAPSKKQWMVLGLVMATVLASVEWKDFSPGAEKTPVLIAEANIKDAGRIGRRHKPDAAEVADVRLDMLSARTESDAELIDVFKSKSWFVPPPPPPPPPPKPVPPPPPSAPPLPYEFLGSYQEADGHLIIFLSRGDRVHSVSPGDILENTYRVDGVVAGQLTLTYLPLNIKQTMSIGGAS